MARPASSQHESAYRQEMRKARAKITGIAVAPQSEVEARAVPQPAQESSGSLMGRASVVAPLPSGGAEAAPVHAGPPGGPAIPQQSEGIEYWTGLAPRFRQAMATGDVGFVRAHMQGVINDRTLDPAQRFELLDVLHLVAHQFDAGDGVGAAETITCYIQLIAQQDDALNGKFALMHGHRPGLHPNLPLLHVLARIHKPAAYDAVYAYGCAICAAESAKQVDFKYLGSFFRAERCLAWPSPGEEMQRQRNPLAAAALVCAVAQSAEHAAEADYRANFDWVRTELAMLGPAAQAWAGRFANAVQIWKRAAAAKDAQLQAWLGR